MARLASPIENLQAHYPVVVVGSGYGGAIAASRLARAGQKVCLLERGKEFQPGEYPDRQPEALREMQTDLPEQHIGPRTGLYDFRMNKEINVFLGCGLGGTSLVNANVALPAEKRVFEDPRWPKEISQDFATELAEGYRRAEEMLKPAPYPATAPALAKVAAHGKSAAALGGKLTLPPINVTFQDGPNQVGVDQRACVGCGDCVSGCNYSAKNTVLMNYLPDARNFGAEIYTQVAVRRLERQGNRWLVHYQVLGSGQEKFDAPTLTLSADLVVLAGGTLGTTEILLRSHAAGLALSGRLGEGFTGNGDVLAFAYNNDEEINGVGFGHHPPGGRKPVGPCIASVIDLRNQPNLDDGMVIEEGSMPGALAPMLPQALAAASAAVGKDTDAGVWDMVKERQRELESLLLGAYRGALRNTQTYLVMTHDNSSGRMVLQNDRLRIAWPGVGQQPIFKRVNERLEKATAPLGGTFVPNPMWSDLFGHDLITVHPLGGCVMADTAERGVVNHKGQVFAGAAGTQVYENLYVCDGSIIPRSLGVNPLLTISALAERSCAYLARERGWKIDYRLPSAPPQPGPPPKMGIQFTERMHGFFSSKVKDSFTRGFEQGRQENSPFEFVLTIRSDDLDTMLSDAAHQAGMVGTVRAPALSPDPLTVAAGRFNLFTKDPDDVDARRMSYAMQLVTDGGRTLYFEGFKRVRSDQGGLDAWADTTTLYVTVYDGGSAQAPVLGRGVLHIDPSDFLKQLGTMQATNAPNTAAALAGVAKFGRFFAGTLFDVYGGIFARPSVFDPAVPPRKKRPLRSPAPDMHACVTPDGVTLRLSRYRGGSKGPVLLAHGLGVSGLIFSIDTIETNLVEYLCAHGYDVWNLDYRASIDLPSARSQFSGDEIAQQDYPAAVKKVLEATGAGSVQAVVHCFGATTFLMSMLGGLQGVRSLVCSQIGTQIKAPLMTRLKTGLHVPDFLNKIGVKSLNAYVDTHSDWLDRLFSEALRLYPVELAEICNNPVCRRIAFMYGPLYRHAQLNDATHSAMHEMFGIANMRSFEHLGVLVRTGHLVSADGKEVYLPHLDRLNLPICFLHGAENECFEPESTGLTFDELCARFGREQYTRHVIPHYGHIDCIFGKNAAQDVYPFIVAHLDKSN